MSVFSAKTGLSSILKTYSPMEREKTKQAFINKVRFQMPKEKSIIKIIKEAVKQNNFQQVAEYIDFLIESELSDEEFYIIISEARKVIYLLNINLTHLVEALLSLPWTNRETNCVEEFSEFCVDLMVAHIDYINFGISKLIELWIPKDLNEIMWKNGTPDENLKTELRAVHKLIDRLLTVIPMSFDVILGTIESKFPYHKKPQHVVAGYIYNILWLLEYRPICMHYLIQMLFQKLILLDVSAPRNEIEDSEYDDEMVEDENIFKMEDDSTKDCPEDISPMKHPVAHTLDICMEVVCNFFDKHFCGGGDTNLRNEKFDEKCNILLNAFDFVLLPTHNTHHVQFLIFYVCNTKKYYADMFLSSLWNKITNPSISAVIRQAAVGYLASFLARSKYLPITVIKHYLNELCSWAHQYILRSDQSNSDGTIKANLVFFSICQAIFYVIAFRSRQLTAGRKGLHFLQSLHLSALVTCNLNPLRVCLPAVATAFAGVTRTYQLAYCHAILERNARRRLATVYAHDIATPEETIDTFFPFDPYLLKLSSKRITECYLQYQANEAEEEPLSTENVRKHESSEMIEDVDDFLIADKRQKINDLAKSVEREAQFTYGLSPGFHK